MSQLDAVLSRIDADVEAALERLFDLLKIKSISTEPAYAGDCRACAEWHAADLESMQLLWMALFALWQILGLPWGL
jgi:hypothetical protein